MSEMRDLLQKDEERQYAKEHFDVEFKAVGYLLAANLILDLSFCPPATNKEDMLCQQPCIKGLADAT